MATAPFTSPTAMKHHSASVMEQFYATASNTVGGSGTACTTPPTISPGSSIGAASSCNNNNNNSAKMITALKWMTAIQDATQCLRNQPSINNDRGRHSIEATEHALKYLVKLETLLKPLEAKWDQAPPMDPPIFEPYKISVKKSFNNKRSNNKKDNKKKDNKKKKGKNRGRSSSLDKSPTSVVSNWTLVTPKGFKNKNSNRFASLFDDDDDDDNSEAGTPTTCSREDEDLHEAGDVPTLNRIAEFPTGNVMSTRRLMIRIVTAQSEIFAYQACGYRKLSNWSLAAETCHASLWRIHQGLLLADSEISRCLSEGGTLVEREPLMEDADVVSVAVRSLTQERDSFVQKALAKKHQLLATLEQHYIARNKARLAMGEEKWRANSKTKVQSSHSNQRGKQEHMLVEIELALDHMLHLDTRALAYSADQLKLRLQHPPAPSGYLMHRHNKQRPSDYVAKRVSYELYPDPSYHDWTFTGSFCEKGSHLEFFEKQGMLLDFDFATGEVELSWKHLSRHGNTTFYRSAGPTPTNLYMRLVASPTPWTVAEDHKKMQAAMPGNTTMAARGRW